MKVFVVSEGGTVVTGNGTLAMSEAVVARTLAGLAKREGREAALRAVCEGVFGGAYVGHEETPQPTDAREVLVTLRIRRRM